MFSIKLSNKKKHNRIKRKLSLVSKNKKSWQSTVVHPEEKFQKEKEICAHKDSYGVYMSFTIYLYLQ